MKKIITLLLAVITGNLLLAQNQVPEVQTPCTTAQQGTAGDVVICYTIGEMTLIDSWQKNGLLITSDGWWRCRSCCSASSPSRSASPG